MKIPFLLALAVLRLAAQQTLSIGVPGVPAGEFIVSCLAPADVSAQVSAFAEGDASVTLRGADKPLRAAQWGRWKLKTDQWPERLNHAVIRLDLRGDSVPDYALFVISGNETAAAEAESNVDFDPKIARPPRDTVGNFRFYLPDPADVGFEVWNKSPGQIKAVYARRFRDYPAGRQVISWNFTDASGTRLVAPGEYVARIAPTSEDWRHRPATVVAYFRIERLTAAPSLLGHPKPNR